MCCQRNMKRVWREVGGNAETAASRPRRGRGHRVHRSGDCGDELVQPRECKLGFRFHAGPWPRAKHTRLGMFPSCARGVLDLPIPASPRTTSAVFVRRGTRPSSASRIFSRFRVQPGSEVGGTPGRIGHRSRIEGRRFTQKNCSPRRILFSAWQGKIGLSRGFKSGPDSIGVLKPATFRRPSRMRYQTAPRPEGSPILDLSGRRDSNPLLELGRLTCNR